MQNLRTSYASQQATTVVVILGILGIVGLGGFFIGNFGIDYQMLIMVFGVITGLFAMVLGERGIRIAFIIWLLMFILGYRATRIYGVTIHPLTVIIFGLFILLILQVGIVQRKTVQLNVPALGWMFSVFWIWGLLLGYVNGFGLGMLTHLLNLSIMIPIFAVLAFVLQRREYWKGSITAMVGASTLIAVLGSLEWHVPAVKSLIPGFAADVEVSADVLGFVRPPFAFWGHSSATFICNMMLPLILPLWVWYKRPTSRVIIILAAAANVYAIYLTGWRSMWSAAMLSLGLMTILSRSWRALFMALIALALVYTFAPPEAKARFETFTDALQGNVSEQDSSSQKRFDRIEEAERMAREKPWGSGFTASGWVHNDPLQLAADLGVLSVVVFGVWYVITLLAIVRKYLRSPDPLTLGLIGSFVVIAMIFTSQPTIQHNQLMAPFWTIWALVYIKLKEPTTEEENIDERSETYGFGSDLQLRNTSARLS